MEGGGDGNIRPSTISIDTVQNDIVLHMVPEVWRHLGPGYQETAYEAALGIEISSAGYIVRHQEHVAHMYKGICVQDGRMDICVYDPANKARLLVIEVKISKGSPHAAPKEKVAALNQIRRYLRSTGTRNGIVVIFQQDGEREGASSSSRQEDSAASPTCIKVAVDLDLDT